MSLRFGRAEDDAEVFVFENIKEIIFCHRCYFQAGQKKRAVFVTWVSAYEDRGAWPYKRTLFEKQELFMVHGMISFKFNDFSANYGDLRSEI